MRNLQEVFDNADALEREKAWRGYLTAAQSLAGVCRYIMLTGRRGFASKVSPASSDVKRDQARALADGIIKSFDAGAALELDVAAAIVERLQDVLAQRTLAARALAGGRQAPKAPAFHAE